MSRKVLRQSYRAQYRFDEFIFSRRRYGVLTFLLDVFMLTVTHGYWVIYIIVRWLRNR